MLHLKSVTGPLVQATSGSGKIFYDGDFGSGGDYKFTTHTGDIEALVPANVSADFSAHSVIGRVQNELPSPAAQPPSGRSRDVPSLAPSARPRRRSCCARSVVKSASSNAEASTRYVVQHWS